MWRFLLLFGLVGSAHAADEQQDPAIEKQEAPKPEPVQPVQVWDQSSGTFVSLSEAVRLARGRLVLDQVPSVRDRVLQADGIKIIEQREQELKRHRQLLNHIENLAFRDRYRGM